MFSPPASPRVAVNGINGKHAAHARTGSEQSSGDGAQLVELDARVLARSCLKEVGKEMGVTH